ncbi:MAG: UDP-3-O-(3-hydroxymyristoyl)glucosamine N-acyltransferase [Alphaproteobacteria bacterium]
MADTRFFKVAGPFSLAELARMAEATLAEPRDGDRRVVDVAPLEVAGPEHLSFLDNRRYVDAFASSRAGACVVAPEHRDRAPAGMALLLSDQPYRSYALAAQAFYPERRPEAARHATAIIDGSARLGEGCVIEAGAVIAERAEIGARCHIGPNAVIGEAVVLGPDCRIGAGATLSHCLVGARVVIYPGARIGQAGFGFALGATGMTKVPQLGRVIIEDDVEVGANSTIDRGAGPDTVIGAGSMIDNLVQIGHNVRLGRGCVVIAQAGVAGSTRIGDHAILAAQAGLIGHLTIGRGARIGAQAGVMRDVPEGESVIGSPAVPVRQFFREVATVQRLAKEKGK